jgi:hypothetical protein
VPSDELVESADVAREVFGESPQLLQDLRALALPIPDRLDEAPELAAGGQCIRRAPQLGIERLALLLERPALTRRCRVGRVRLELLEGAGGDLGGRVGSSITCSMVDSNASSSSPIGISRSFRQLAFPFRLCAAQP